MAIGIAKTGFTLQQRNITKNEVCPRKNVKFTLFRLAIVIQVLLITLTTRSVYRPTLVVHKILVKNETCHLYYVP